MYTALLAYRYAAYHWGKTLILIVALACTMFVPMALHALLDAGEAQLMQRAKFTPLIVGAPGSRVDLVLHALHFAEKPVNTLAWRDLEAIQGHEPRAIPLFIAFTARGFPIVGTSLDYFEFRTLRQREGTLPLMLGDCVVGAEVAQALGLHPGDALVSDPENVFNLAGAYPLKMHVAGVLEPRATDDDRAVFVDIKTAWVIAGLGHGHQDMTQAPADVVLKRRDNEVVANAALPQYTEITPENIGSFHFHGDTGDFPVTAVIVSPENEKSGTILEGRLAENSSRWQAVRPTHVIDELMATIVKVKRLFDANVALAALTTALLLGLVVLLSIRMRADEMTTMMKLGCSRGTMLRLQAVELAGILVLSAVLAAVAARAVSQGAMTLIPWLMG